MAPKYGTLEWEEQYLKNRRPNPVWDFKSLTEIYKQFANGEFYMAFCKTNNKWVTGEYPVGGFRYMISLRAALQFNGVWKTEQKAKDFIEARNKKYGQECEEVEIIKKNVVDEDILTALVGHFKIV